MTDHVEQAVILAAGMGSRIRGEAQPLPKPLVEVGGMPLLKRTMLTARRAGVTRFVIVVGCDGDRVRNALEFDPDLMTLEMVWVENPDYQLGNGVSVLAARPYIEGEFFLTMADHIIDPAIFQQLQLKPAGEGLVLAVDRKLATIFDMDDATKVQVVDGKIDEIGKLIPNYDAVDTGVFRCSQHLFQALSAVYEATGDASLSQGVQTLAAQGHARVEDVGDAWWQDVDTPETRRYAETLLARSLTSFDTPVELRNAEKSLDLNAG